MAHEYTSDALPRGFHWLTVADVRRETADAISVAFAVPAALIEAFTFVQGQYITLLRTFDGEELRRPYSVCVAPDDAELRVCVKTLPNGRMSTFVNTALKIGDRIPVMEPNGRFHHPIVPDAARDYVLVAGGSGITPVLSILKTVLRHESKSRCTLFYGNRMVASIIFRDELTDLKDRYLERLQVFHVLSDESNGVPLLEGLMDQEKITALLQAFTDSEAVDLFFICGPGPMMDGARAALTALKVPRERIKIEDFGTDRPIHASAVAAVADPAAPAAEATIIIGGVHTKVRVPYTGRVLDSALAARLDLPFACKGGVCCTCRARLVEGEVVMAANYGLEPEEIERGFILTCQASPKTERLIIDYDAV